jgi:hypothetical protein
MRITVAASVCLLASVAAMPATAGCTRPGDISATVIPDGATATRDQMIAAQRAVKAYDNAVREYTDCLQKGGDDVSKQGDDAVKKDQQLADRFNSELHAFKARNTGG